MNIRKHSCIAAWSISIPDLLESLFQILQYLVTSWKWLRLLNTLYRVWRPCHNNLMLLVSFSVAGFSLHWPLGMKRGVCVKKHAPFGTAYEVKGYWCKGRNSHCAGQVSLSGFKLSCIDQKVERLKTESCIVFWTLAFTALEQICCMCPT